MGRVKSHVMKGEEPSEMGPHACPTVNHLSPHRRGESLGGWLLDLVVVGCALAMLNGYALDLFLGHVLPPVALSLTVIELALVVLRGHRRSGSLGDPAELCGLGVVIAGTFLFFLVPSLPSLYPPSSGVDAAHHYLLANYIFQHGALPHDHASLAPYLGEMTVYPFGPALLLALVSCVTGQEPLVLLHPFMSLVRGLTAGYVFLVAYRLSRPGAHGLPAGLAASILLFAPAEYFVGSLIGQQYYMAMTFAELLIVALFAQARLGVPSLVYTTLFSLAVVLTYPGWLSVVILWAGVLLIMRATTWRRLMSDALIYGACLGGLLLVFLPGRMEAGASVLRWEGIAAPATAAAFGWPLIVLAGLGLASAFRQWRRHKSLLMIAAVCLAQVVVYWVLADVLHLAARYHVQKSAYVLVYPAVLLAAVVLAHLIERAGSKVGMYVSGLAAVGLAFVISCWGLSAAPHAKPISVLSPDAVAVARWARDHVETTDIGYRTRHGITSYWLHVAILGNKRESFITDSFIELLPMTVQEWLNGGTWPTYFLMEDIGELPSSTDVSVLHRQGNTALLARQLALPATPSLPRRADATIGGIIHLAGYTAPRTLTPGSTLTIDLHWYVEHWPRRPVAHIMYAHLLDSSNRPWAKVDHEVLDGRYPSLRWPVGIVNTDRFVLHVPADAPPGRYVVQVGVYPADTAQDLPVRRGEEKLVDRLLLVPFKVPLPRLSIKPTKETQYTFGGRVTLVGYDVSTVEAKPGGTVIVRLYWQALMEMEDDYTIFVHLAGQDGRPVAQCDMQPHGGIYPTSVWDVGETVVEECRLTLPPNVAPGLYSLRVGLYWWPSLIRLPLNGGDSADLETIRVTTP